MAILIILITVCFTVNAEYRGGFGPRTRDDSMSFVQKRNDNYADLLTKNNQQPISAALIPVAAPTIYRPPDPNQPIYLEGPTFPPFMFQTTTNRPSQQLSNDLSRVPRPANSNPFSERDKLFGIKPLPDSRVSQPFNPSPNLYGQQVIGFDKFPQPEPFNVPNNFNNNARIIETISDLRVYPAKINHAIVGAIGQNQPRQQINVPLVPTRHIQEIGRFDTNVNRFASDSEVQQRQRFILPMDLANSPLESFLRRPDSNQPRPVVSVGTQPANANTRFLVSDIKKEMTTTTMGTLLGQGHTLPPESATPFTTYPDYRADVFPELINHAHDDKRPATGRRVGPQGRFGGGTNEYLEDLGIRTFGINDRRQLWEQLPGRFGNEPTNRPPNADYKNVALQTIHSSNNNPQQMNSTRLDQDLTKTQPFSSISFGKYDKDWSELITPAPKSFVATTVVGVPLYPEFGIGYHGKSGSGPANKYFGAAISPPASGARIELESVNGELDEGLRPYQGPEDITNSRYQPIPSNQRRNFKLDLLNE